MLKIKDRQWMEFKISELFDFEMGFYWQLPKHVRGKRTIPFVSCSQLNNGVIDILSIEDIETSGKNQDDKTLYDLKKKIFPGNRLTISTDGTTSGVAFYQKYTFTANFITCIANPKFEMNEFNGQFIARAITMNKDNYSYGNKWKLTRTRNSKILLPVRQDDPSSPDYDFMTDFIRERMDAKRQVYVDYCLDKLRRLESDLDDVLATECDDNLGCDDMTCEGAGDRVWKEFKIKDLFKHTRGKRQIKENRTPGNIPYYSASEINNGLTDYISNPAFVINEEAICCSTFGDAYYVKPNFTTSDEVTILISPNINEFTGLFIAQAIKNNKEKYSFGRKAFSNKILNDSIILPCDKNSVPDWKYMEQQIKSLKLKKINEYLAHVKKYVGRGIKLTY